MGETEPNQFEATWQGLSAKEVDPSPTELETREKGVDVAEVCREYNCFVVHGLFKETNKATGSAGNNHVTRKDLNWEQNLGIVTLLSPSIPCSTVRLGSSDGIWGSGFGVILSGGKIVQAKPSFGAATFATDIKQRTGGYVYHSDIDAQIMSAITRKQDTAINELIVNEPKVSGFFIQKRQGPNGEYFAYPPNCINVIEDFEMPVYLIDGGHVYEGVLSAPVYDAKYNIIAHLNKTEIPETRAELIEMYPDADCIDIFFDKGAEVGIEQILSGHYSLSSKKKERILEEFRTNSPFHEHINWEQHIT